MGENQKPDHRRSGALGVLLAVIPWLVEPLNKFTFIGFPLGYYMIAQGSLIAFVVMIWVQNWRQDAIDDEFGYGEE